MIWFVLFFDKNQYVCLGVTNSNRTIIHTVRGSDREIHTSLTMNHPKSGSDREHVVLYPSQRIGLAQIENSSLSEPPTTYSKSEDSGNCPRKLFEGGVQFVELSSPRASM